MTSGSSKVMACSSAMAPVALIGSPKKAFTSHFCSSSFTSASVAPWRTVASTIDPTRHNAQTANSKPRTTKADNAIQDSNREGRTQAEGSGPKRRSHDRTIELGGLLPETQPSGGLL